MKKILVLTCLLGFAVITDAQLKGVLDRIKQRAKDKSNEKVNSNADNTVDTALNKTERTVKDVAKDITTKDSTKKTKNENVANSDSGLNNNATGNTNVSSVNNEDKAAPIKAYSKYDFVPGEKIIVYEDFMQDAVGDLPAKWNTNATGETVTIDGKPGQWLKIVKPGWFIPDFVDSLPSDFTLEYDMFADAAVHSWGFTTSLAELKNKEKPTDNTEHVNSFTFNILPGVDGRGSTSYERIKNGTWEPGTNSPTSHFSNITKTYHIAIWRQKERLRIYFDEEKAWDIPKAFSPETKLNSVYFYMELSDNWHFYISNLRLAVGVPDTRKKILEQNKWVTHGILFDVNSDNIKPESYGTLKEMATVLKDFPDLKVKIIGHTDADGNDESNLDLSKRRAASVKESLVKEFNIDAVRMETDGKGESEPIDNNITPAGKANNRRVEFIKI